MDKDEIRQCFGRVLKRLRLEKNFSQEKLALICDIDRSYMSLLERGKRQASLATLFALAEQLEVKPSLMVELLEQELAK